MSEVLRIEHGVRAPAQARRWIVQRCKAWDCEALADSAALLVSELVTNVFLHARTNGLIRASFDFPVLVVTVTDEDGDHGLSPQPSSDGTVGGRGLAIVAQFADTWGVDHGNGTKSVWFRLVSATPPQCQPVVPSVQPTAGA